MTSLVPKLTFTLYVLVLTGGCSDAKVLQEIPSEIRGVWDGMNSDPRISLIIKKDKLVVINREYPSFTCKAEQIVSYKAGWVFKEKKVAVICNKNSTDKDQQDIKYFGTIIPDDYRKRIYIRAPNKLGEISVSHTKFMSKGWSGSEGVYEWDMDEFYKR